MRAERVTDSVTYHGEGALWHAEWGGLKWVDMLAGDVLSLDEKTGAVSRLHVGSNVAALVRPRRTGGFVVATHSSFAAWNDDGEEWRTPDLWTRGMRFNEGTCDPLGRVICGTIADERTEGSGEIWRLDLDGVARRVSTGVTISNGMGFTSDGTGAYYVDTRTRRIDIFDFDDGELVNRRPFAAMPEGAGGPDGICVDSEDGVWVAMYNGYGVRHYSASGEFDAAVEVPDAARVTSCSLGGDALSTLYITTSREGLAPSDEPAAGSLYRADVGVPGLPALTAAL